MAIRIGIIVDWARSARANDWRALLDEMPQSGMQELVVTSYPLADLIVQPADEAARFLTQDLDVLVINWDAANGDPEFGGHLAQRWLEHRRPELLLWVRDGGLLIIEGQAIMSVPTGPAYTALLGPDELPVSGAQDRLDPMRQQRVGGQCRKTRHIPNVKGFESIPSKLTVRGRPTHHSLFPGAAAKLLTAHISTTDWSQVLYRGWFRRTVFGRNVLPWVPIIETADRPWGFNQTTLAVAHVGEGAIFASTLFLATTRQYELVGAMLRCTGRHTDHLPKPLVFAEHLRNGVKYVLPALAGLGVAYLTDVVDHALTWIGVAHVAGDTLTGIVKAAFVPVGLLVFEALVRLVRLVIDTFRSIMGY